MPTAKEKPRMRPPNGDEAATTRTGNEAARRNVVANDPLPKAQKGEDENAAYEAEHARQIALAKEIMQEDHELLRLLADR